MKGVYPMEIESPITSTRLTSYGFAAKKIKERTRKEATLN
jgi:hypothetical protein